MALDKKVYGVRIPGSARNLAVYGIFAAHSKSQKTVAAQSEIGNLAGFELEGQFVSDKGNKFGIRRFSLGIANRIAEKSLQCVQVTSVPCHFTGVTDGAFNPAGGGLEGFCHLGVQYFGDGIGVPYGPPGGLAGCSRRTLQRLRAKVDDLLLSLSSRNSLLYGFENMIAKRKWKVKLETNEHFRKFLSAFSALQKRK